MTAPGQWLASRKVQRTAAGRQPPAPSATCVSKLKASPTGMHFSRPQGTCRGGTIPLHWVLKQLQFYSNFERDLDKFLLAPSFARVSTLNGSPAGTHFRWPHGSCVM